MALLIDGYNLLHVTGLFGSTFEASRAALLGFLVAAIETNERARTTIVFDAAEAPPGLPDRFDVEGIQVYYARNHESADELLEELIALHHTPHKLTVVSSDHRVQRAAKKRRATPVDSHVWYRAAAEQLHKRKSGSHELPDVKPDVPPTRGEVEVWLRLFGPIEVEDETLLETLSPPPPQPPAPPPKPQRGKAGKRRAATSSEAPQRIRPKAVRPTKPRASKKRGKPKNLGFGDIANPFPPGYGEDVVE